MRSSVVPVCNDVAPVRRMLAPLGSDLAAVCSVMVPVSRPVALLRSFYGVVAQVGWRRSINLNGAAAQVRAVLYHIPLHRKLQIVGRSREAI
jgi:hypothetical protein